MRGAAIVIGVAGSASGQDLLVTLEQSGPEQYSIVAEFLGVASPINTLVTIWGETHFELSGDGSDIEWASTNPAYTSQIFGGPVLTEGPTASFIGLQTSLTGSPDPSNPLRVADFRYAGDPVDLDMVFLGLNTGTFLSPVSPTSFEILFYTIDGQPGDATIEFQPIPAPASVAFLGASALLMRRRR